MMKNSIKHLSLLATTGLLGLSSLSIASPVNASPIEYFRGHRFSVEQERQDFSQSDRDFPTVTVAKSRRYNPSYQGVLYCQDANVKINIRSGPGTNYGVQYSSFAGLEVDVVSSIRGYDGYEWYEIVYVDQILHQSESGWVREDLLQIL